MGLPKGFFNKAFKVHEGKLVTTAKYNELTGNQPAVQDKPKATNTEDTETKRTVKKNAVSSVLGL